MLIILIDFSVEENNTYKKEFSQSYASTTRNCVNCDTNYFYYIESKDGEEFFIPQQIDFPNDFRDGQKFTIYKTSLLNRNNKIEYYYQSKQLVRNISLLNIKLIYYTFIVIVLLSLLYLIFSNFKYAEGMLGIATLINICIVVSYFCNF